MKILRVYVDTSVIGGCFDAEFDLWSRRLIEDFQHGRFRPVLSDVTAAEIASAPKPVRNLHSQLLALPSEIVPVTQEALDLLSLYQDRRILGPRFRNDMLHIALATVADVDVLVSWNFRYIVRFDKIRLFNAANIEQGYKMLSIYSPREVTADENEE